MCVDIIIILGAQNVSNQFKINANAATISPLPTKISENTQPIRIHGCVDGADGGDGVDGDPWANKPGARKSLVAVFQSCRCSGCGLPAHPQLPWQLCM